MSVKMDSYDLASAMNQETYDLWMDIGRRLIKGEQQYGGFKFAEYDLDQMALEEIEDFIVYRAAKKYLAAKEKRDVG